MFVGLQPKNKYFDEEQSMEINNAFKNIDSAIEDYNATDLKYKYPSNELSITGLNGLEINNYSFYAGKELVINIKVNHKSNYSDTVIAKLPFAVTERVYLFGATADKRQVTVYIPEGSKTIQVNAYPSSDFYIYGNIIMANNPLIL